MPDIPRRVRDVMTTAVVSVAPETSVLAAVRRMLEHDLSGLPVVDDQGRVVGMLTERDCIDAALQGGYFDAPTASVATCMARPVRCVSPDDALMDVAQLFANQPFRRCPVVEDGVLVGLISRRHVLETLLTGDWFPAPNDSTKDS